MYLINTHLSGIDANYPDDFSMLTNGSKFAMRRQGTDYIIQTTIGDDNKLMDIIKTGEANIKERIAYANQFAQKENNFVFRV